MTGIIKPTALFNLEKRGAIKFSNTKTFISLYNIKMANKPSPNKKITSTIRSTTTVPISVEMGMLSVLLSTAHLETSPILGNAKLARYPIITA